SSSHPSIKRGHAMIISARISPSRLVALALVTFLLSNIPASAQKRRAVEGGSARSHARAMKVLEDGMAALGGLEAIRANQEVSVKIKGFSYAVNHCVVGKPP